MTGRILVVDDDTALAEMIGIVLTSDGFETSFCADGALAVDAWRIEIAPPDQQGALVAVYSLGYRIALMVAGVLGVMHFLPQNGSAGNLTGFFLCFMLLFATAGIGNGSTFRMIPVIFMDEALEAARGREGEAEAVVRGNKMGAAVLGFTGAIGAYGGFFIPKSYGTSIAMTGSPHAALWWFIVFYASCIVLTWWFYARRGARRPC